MSVRQRVQEQKVSGSTKNTAVLNFCNKMCNVLMVYMLGAVEELCNVASGNGMLGAVEECSGCGGSSTGS